MTWKGILITGSHRSGSTWLGRLLAEADGLHYVHEPFNIVARVRWTASRPPQQFHYVCHDNEGGWDTELDAVMQLRFPALPQAAASIRAGRGRRLARLTRDARRARSLGERPLIKDPIALFSTEWLAERHGLQPVILVRSPVSFVGSLTRRKWSFDFRHWAEQPLLMDRLLGDYRDQIQAQVDRPGTIVEQAVLQWNVFYSVVERFRAEHPEWLVVRYEDLAAEPGVEIPRLYGQLGLEFGAGQAKLLQEMSSGGDGEGTGAMDLKRDSQAATETWKERLSPDEVAFVEEATAEVATRFYP